MFSLFLKKNNGTTHQSMAVLHLSRRNVFWVRLLTLVWMIVIFVLSTLSGEQLPVITWVPSPDKWAHAAVYALLAAGLWFSLAAATIHQNSQNSIALGIAASYGIGMEIIQYTFFPGRYFEVWDIVANIIGAFGALVVLNKFFNHS